MRVASSTILLLLPAALAAGQGTVLLDQIGPPDASAIVLGVLPQNQDFANDGQIFTDIMVIESFANPDGQPLARVQTIVGGMAGYGGLDGIAGMHIMVFETAEDAEIGDPNLMLVDVIVAGPPAGDPDWALAGSMDLVTIFGGPWPCRAGNLWIAVTPVNEFAANGITGQGLSSLGDGGCVQVNPSGIGGWTLRSIGLDAAISITAGPCAVPLPEDCPADIAGDDDLVDVDDILRVIATFGDVSDGVIRPAGDCAPLPFGDCVVDVNDLLAIIAAFGSDCRPRGACCLGLSGCESDTTEEDCVSAPGNWLGEGTDCTICVVGACCMADQSCLELPDIQCTDAGATFQGQGVSCDDVECPVVFGACCIGDPKDGVTCLELLLTDCADFAGIFMGVNTTCEQGTCIAANDTCQQAATAHLGGNAFDTSQATDSGFGDPDESMCPDSYLNWNDSRDVWFHFHSRRGRIADISTCDADSFDTSLVIYRGTSCGDLEQIACNGDGDGETGCQFYWSNVDNLPVYAGDELWIRIGGYEGAGGPGTLTLTAGGNLEPGACCVDGACIGELLEVHCVMNGGHWVGPWPCADILCGGPTGPCGTGLGEDPVHPDLDWIAGTSDSTAGISRAQSIDATTISTLRVHGLAMQFNDGWSSCNAPELTFRIRTWMDDGKGRPGTLLVDLAGLEPGGPVAATVYPTPLGFVTLLAWDLTVNSSPGAHQWLSVQSTSSDANPCLFLWMSSTEEGGGTSLVDQGDGWQVETFGLNYCISE